MPTTHHPEQAGYSNTSNGSGPVERPLRGGPAPTSSTRPQTRRSQPGSWLKADAVIGSVEDRFWAKVAIGPAGACWLWTASTDSAGYGKFYVAGRLQRASRVSYVLHFGDIPDGRPFVLHRCDNPPCVNPAHLYTGTQADNIRDAINRGRHNPGRKFVHLRDEIRRAYRDGESQTDIAERLGCSQPLVSKYLRGRNPRPAGQLFNTEQVSDIKRRHSGGERAEDIATDLGCSHATIYRYLNPATR